MISTLSEAEAAALSANFSTKPWYNVDFTLAFRDASLKALYELWQRKCSVDRLPARSDFGFDELRPYFGRVYICAVNAQRTDLTFTLIGTEIVEHLGSDSTGRSVLDVMGRSVHRMDMHLVSHPRALREYGHVGWRDADREHKSFETVVLPLASDGVTVDRLFGAIVMD